MLPECSLWTWIEWLERALDNHPATEAPAGEFDIQFSESDEALVRASLPGVPRDGGNGAFDVGGELEFEKKRKEKRDVCLRLVRVRP